MQKYPVQCITKPLSRKKLLQTLIANQPARTEKAIEVIPHIEKMPLTVMAVDDNPANLKLITALLQERVETVVSCSSGEDAIERAKECHFDIILMDIQMPKMDGVTACHEIKKLKLNSNTPIIAVTAHAMVGERERLLKAGMDDYLTKPIEEHILQQVLLHWSLKPETDEAITLEHQEPIELEEIQVEESAPVNATVAIDWPLALRQAANKENLAKDMLKMLVASFKEINQVIEMALNDDEYPATDLLHHIHKLHGSCSYSGVPRLKKVCETLEHTLRSGARVQDVEPELFELQDEMEKVVASADPYLV
jgi:two-component system sensor histidine kinase BarA